MANVSREVLEHAALLHRGAQLLHEVQDLEPPLKTTLVTPDCDWDIRLRHTWQPERLPPIDSHRAARLGHYVVSSATRRPNVFGQSAFVRAATIGVEETTFTAEHGYGPSQRYQGNQDGNYALRIVGVQAANQERGVLSNETPEGRDVIERFMALTLNQIWLAPSRSLESLAADYHRMEHAMAGLADTHGKTPLDGTIYYFNAGNYIVQIGSSERMVPGRNEQSDTLGWVGMKLYHVTPDQQWDFVASVNAESPTSDQPASVSAYEMLKFGDQSRVREFDDQETHHIVGLIETICGQPSDFSVAYSPDLASDSVLEQVRLAMLEVDLLPITRLDVTPLNLQSVWYENP